MDPQHSAAKPTCKHQHERQDLDPSVLRLSGQTTIYSYRCRLETTVTAGCHKQCCSVRELQYQPVINGLMNKIYT